MLVSDEVSNRDHSIQNRDFWTIHLLFNSKNPLDYLN